MSKSFNRLREEQYILEEIDSKIGQGVNYLQRLYWENWAEANYEYGKMCPIMSQPYEQIVPGGILVVGYNPGWTTGLDKKLEKSFQTKGNWKKEMHEVFKASGGKYIFAPYKTSQQSFDNKGLTTPPGVEGGGFTSAYRDKETGDYDHSAPHVRTGPDYAYSHYTMAWQLQTKKPDFLKEVDGAYMYHAQLAKMFYDGGMSNHIRDICSTNLIHFPSKDVASLYGSGSVKKNELEKLSWDHCLKNLLKLMKPRAIICPTNIYDILTKLAGIKTLGVRNQKEYIDKNDPSKGTRDYRHPKWNKEQKYLRWGVTSKGAKVLGILHWSGSQKGGTHKLDWKLMTKPDPESGVTDAQKLFSILLDKGN